MEWTNEICLKLIEEYQMHPALWDQTCPHYKNKMKRKESWALLAERFACSKAEVERKMNVLLTQYRREKHKIMILQRYKNGEVRKNSRWYAFKKFSFMDGGFIPKKCALQLYGEMQMRLGLPHIQAGQMLPNLLWNSDIQNHLNHNSHENNEPNKYSDLNHQMLNNRNNNINNNSSVCPSVQDLSMNSSTASQLKLNSSNESKTGPTNNNRLTDDDDDDDEEEIMEIHVDPGNIDRSSRLSNCSVKNLSHNNNTNGGYPDIKDEIFDEINTNDYNVHDYAADDDDDDDDDHDNNAYHPNNFISSSSCNNNTHHNKPFPHKFKSFLLPRKRATQFSNNFDPEQSIRNNNTKPSTATSFRSVANYHSDIQAIAERVIKNDREKDDCDLIGLNVALKLRSMDESQRIVAEKLISDVLFYGQFNELCKSASISPTANTTSRQNDGSSS